MSIFSDISTLTGQRALIEAKMKEFEGHRLIGNRMTADACREEAHTLMDAWFDGQADVAEIMRRGGYSSSV